MQILCFAGIALILFIILYNLCRIKPPAKAAQKDYTPVYLTLADKPDNIMRGMDKLIAETRQMESASQRWWWLPLVVFAAGIALMLIDGLMFVFGYVSIIFTAGGVLLWIAAFWLAFGLRRSRAQAFPPRYAGSKEIFHTLRDDLRPGGTFLGHLDLTGALLPTKVAHEASDSQNRTTQYFRDEWLSLKAKLYDGNVLRVSALQRSKQRKSYWKRSSISGKMKLKPAKFKGSEQQLKVRIAVNPEAYKIVSNVKFKQGLSVGKYTVAQLSTEGGIIDFVASSPFDEIESENILNVLRSAYTLLQRKAA
ncbi:MAG TPA: hypothetical protein VGJ22_10660 [Anaerolineales bacterium]|jgi:hypothetical protein